MSEGVIGARAQARNNISCPRGEGRGGGRAACSASAISSGQVTARTTRIGPLHRWQTETSIRKTRASRLIHESRKIRKYLVDNNYVDAIIQLPPDLFFGTTIATCVIILKKSKADNSVLFIDASAELTRNGNKNVLDPEHRRKILDAFVARESIPHFAKLVPHAALAKNAYNLSVAAYVEEEDTREPINITALNVEIARIVSRQSSLRTQIDAIVADLEPAALQDAP